MWYMVCKKNVKGNGNGDCMGYRNKYTTLNGGSKKSHWL